MHALFSKLRSIKHRLRYGLLMEAVQRRLASIGIVLEPYYWVQEGIDPVDPAELPGNFDDFCLRFLSLEEIRALAALKELGCGEEELLERVTAGQMCFGALHGGEVAAFMWIDLHRCSWKHHEFDLQPDEAYLFNMCTVIAFRGRGLAPYVRCQCYKHLRQLGRDKLYSYSDLFNTPSIKFKKKLGARFSSYGVSIELFGWWRCNWGGRQTASCPKVAAAAAGSA